MLYRTSTAVLIGVLALMAWGAVGYFAWTIDADENQRAQSARDAQMTTIQNAQAIRTHALALDAALDGEKLKGLLDVDVVSASYLIEEVGRATGVKVRLSAAQPEGNVESGILPLKAVGIVVTADGRFSDLLRVVRLIETLPVPSSVTRLDIERAPKSSGNTSGVWHLNVYVRILTTTQI